MVLYSLVILNMLGNYCVGGRLLMIGCSVLKL